MNCKIYPALLAFLLIALNACQPHAKSRSAVPVTEAATLTESEIDALCLRKSYPQIESIRPAPDGALQIRLSDGTAISYDEQESSSSPLAVSLRQSLAQTYPLEPERPDTPAGVSPGRQRSYDFLGALYGKNREEATRQLVTVDFLGQPVRMTKQAAAALERVAAKLKNSSRHSQLLHSDGGFAWRRIAGENVASTHSYGIAIDLSAKHAPYWRWSRQMPHPMQKTYPSDIVKAFEEEGFIWGGKWHEYDLMHFEYRPELICKTQYKRQHSENKEIGQRMK